MGKKVHKTLYFIRGVAPTEEQQAEADEMKGNVCFRNTTMLRDDASLEDFDAVAGEVPPAYQAEADRKAALAEGQPPAPKASPNAPAAPQRAAATAPAKPTGATPGGAWKSN